MITDLLEGLFRLEDFLILSMMSLEGVGAGCLLVEGMGLAKAAAAASEGAMHWRSIKKALATVKSGTAGCPVAFLQWKVHAEGMLWKFP